MARVSVRVAGFNVDVEVNLDVDELHRPDSLVGDGLVEGVDEAVRRAKAALQ